MIQASQIHDTAPTFDDHLFDHDGSGKPAGKRIAGIRKGGCLEDWDSDFSI
jgi:hypothetical protein